jgi:hypothetical protein
MGGDTHDGNLADEVAELRAAISIVEGVTNKTADPWLRTAVDRLHAVTESLDRLITATKSRSLSGKDQREGSLSQCYNEYAEKFIEDVLYKKVLFYYDFLGFSFGKHALTRGRCSRSSFSIKASE